MTEITPEVRIEGISVDYIDGMYQNTGGLTSATLQFKLPKTYAGYKHLWNKEVTFVLNSFEKPLFRGYIKRVKENFDDVEIIAQDVMGYMVKGGNPEKAKIALTDRENLDGLTAGNAIRKAISMALLDTKVKTDIIGDTTPSVSSSRPPLRGTLGILEIIKEMVGRAIDNSGTLPRPNMAKIVDDGSASQLVIELESDVDVDDVKYVFTEHNNITGLKIVNRKVPTIVVVNGQGGVKGTFSHDTAIEAYDRNYLEVTNGALTSPAACKDFAQKLFRANLVTQYEYGIETFEGAHLEENDVIRIETEDRKFSGNYRVRGKKINFTPSSFNVGLNINRKPPTLVEYINQQDN
jgi:hypothetical protein|tara:strand:- start:660 stop:1709 length:1050 start_codon:yes stop_codon:yes gene_type:complete